MSSSAQSHPTQPILLGVDLGGSSIKAVAVTSAGQILERRNVEFDPGRVLDWGERIRELIAELRAAQRAPAARIGLSAPGLASPDGRSIGYMPGRLRGLERLDWTTFLQSPSVVPVLNDAHAALLGEAWLGAAAGCANAVLLTLGTGVGGAVMVDGRLLRGQIGRAGHLGHICLDIDGTPDIVSTPGSLELMVGNCSIQERSHGRFASTHELIAAVSGGDEAAREVWLRSLQALACAITSFINILDPERVIIGGGIARAGQALFEPLERMLRPLEWQPGGHKVLIVPAALGEYAGALGAAWQTVTGAQQEENAPVLG